MIQRSFQAPLHFSEGVGRESADLFSEFRAVEGGHVMTNREARSPQTSGASRDRDHRGSAFGLRTGCR